MSSTSARVGLAGLLLGLLLPLETAAAIIGAFEGPDDGQIAAGVGIIRGWAFSDTAGVRVTQVTLRIDETQPLAIPCCSARQDVQGAFPQYPAENTYHSGFGVTFNYGNLAAGPHTLVVEVHDSSGTQTRFTHPVAVVKLADSAYVDRVDLTGASATREGQEVLIAGLRVRDKASQKIAQVNARLRWFQNLQGLGLVAATTTSTAGVLAPLATPVGVSATPSQAVAEIPHAALESPNSGETGAGIAILRGWVIAPAGRAIQQVQLLVDGQPTLTVPCCSRRTDVAAAFPNESNAANSGFGATLNYGNLTPGVHRLTVDITDSGGAKRRFTRGILTRRPGNFSFLTQLDFGSATVRLAGGELVLQGALATDKATGQTARSDLRYRWDNAAQAFLLAEESVDTVTVVNTNCDVNGDTASLDALRQSPGPDGISLQEAVQAINQIGNSLASGNRVAVDFARGGEWPSECPDILYGKIALNGDTDGDGVPNVTLSGSGDFLGTSGSDITVRSFMINKEVRSGVSINRSAADIAFLSNILVGGISLGSAGPHVGESGQVGPVTVPAAADDTSMKRVLISGNEIKSSGDRLLLASVGDVSDPALIELTQINVFNNNMACENKSYCHVIVFEDAHNSKPAITMEAVVSQNIIINQAAGGSAVWVSGIYQDRPVAVSTKIMEVTGNSIVNQNNNIENDKHGIFLRGGYTEPSQNSTIIAKLLENTIEGHFLSGIHSVAGSQGANKNTAVLDIRNNTLNLQFSESSEEAIAVQGGNDASSNTVDVELFRNTINISPQSSSSGARGILLSGGTACLGCNPPAPSLDNLVTGNLTSNTTQDANPDNTDIAVFGAVQNDPTKTVIENQVLANIIGNTARRILCEDHVPGNTAKCVCQDNTSECTTTASAAGSGSRSLSSSVSTRWIQQLTGHQGRVMAREQEFREKAKQTNDPQLSIQYLEIADRFHDLSDRLATHIQRGW
ncbi:MAG: hypothetical protein U1F70_09815 [Candidatus Competibacteraceae bacterium]